MIKSGGNTPPPAHKHTQTHTSSDASRYNVVEWDTIWILKVFYLIWRTREIFRCSRLNHLIRMASVRLKINLYIQICLKVRIFLFKMMLWLFYFLLNLYMIDQEIFFNPFFFRMKGGGGFFFRILPILITLIDGCLKKKKNHRIKGSI